MTGIQRNAGSVPDITWRYWGLIETMERNPGMYGLDDRREEYHDQLCEHYKISRKVSKEVTDHLGKYDNAVEMHNALKRLDTLDSKEDVLELAINREEIRKQKKEITKGVISEFMGEHKNGQAMFVKDLIHWLDKEEDENETKAND